MRYIITQLPIFFLFLLSTCFYSFLEAQGQNGEEILFSDPVLGPEVQVIYINNLDRKKNVTCGESILTEDLLNTAADGELPVYLILLRNFGGIDLHIQEESIKMVGEKFSLTKPLWRTFPDGLFHAGDEVILEITQNSQCFNSGSGDLVLSINGLPEKPCRITFIETIQPGASENALLILRESINSYDLDPDDGVYDIEPVALRSDGGSKFLTIQNIGNREAIIFGITSEGHAEIFENTRFPVLIPAGGFWSFRVLNTSFTCGARTGKFIFDTDAEFGQCGFNNSDGVIPYRQASYLDCPGSDYTLAVDGSIINCGVTVSFDDDFIPNADVRTFTVTNTGTGRLAFLIDRLVYGQRSLRPEFTLDYECDDTIFWDCLNVLAPGESHSFTVTQTSGCPGGRDCEAFIRLEFSTSPYNCRINLSDAPAGISTPDFPKPGSKSLIGLGGKELRVFPTLTNQSITVTVGEALEAATEVQLIDQLGRQVKNVTLQPFTLRTQLSVSDLPSGMYYVRIAGTRETRRIIKQ